MSLKKNDEKIILGPGTEKQPRIFFFFFPVVFVEALILIHVDKLPILEWI